MGFWDKIGGALSNKWVRGASAVAGLAGATGLLNNSDGSAMTLGKTLGTDSLGGLGNLSLTSLAGGANLLSGGAAALSGKDTMGGLAQMGLGGYNVLQNNTLSDLSGGLISQDSKVGQFGNFGSLFSSSGSAAPSVAGKANAATATGIPGTASATAGSTSAAVSPLRVSGSAAGSSGSGVDTKGAFSALTNDNQDLTKALDTGYDNAITKAMSPAGATAPSTPTMPSLAGATQAAGSKAADIGGGIKQVALNNGMTQFTMPDGSSSVVHPQYGVLWKGGAPAPQISFTDKVMEGLAKNPAQAIGAGAMVMNMFQPDPAEAFMKDYESRLAKYSGNMSPDSPVAKQYMTDYTARRQRDLDTQYAAARANLEAQYAQRGMLDSSVYAKAVTDLEKEYMNTYSNVSKEAWDAWMNFATKQQTINQSAAESAAMPGKVVAAMNQPTNFSGAAQSLALSR